MSSTTARAWPSDRPTVKSRATTVLNAAVGFWLGMALLGQWAFFYYIAAFYGTSTISGQLELWNRLQALGRTPFVVGDTLGNGVFAAHALGAGIVALGGALQLIPWVRSRFPRFHRWNGRVFLLTVVALSLSGFYLVWVRRTSPSTFEALSTSLNGVLILAFAFFAYATARARKFVIHRRWAMRLYLVSNAQWFLRVGVFAYFMVSRMVGHDVGRGDLFLRFWTFGCYLFPLLVLELYLRAKDSPRPWPRYTMAGGLAGLTLVMAIGMLGFALFSQKLITGAPLAFP